MGKSWFEEAILEEVSELITVLKRYGGKPFNPSAHLMVGVSNLICAMSFGQRYGQSDVRFQKLQSLVGENLQILSAILPLQFLPFLQYVPFEPLYYVRKQLQENVDTVKEFVRSLIVGRRTKTSEDESVEGGDYISRFDDEERKKKTTKSLSTFPGTRMQAPSLAS